MAKVKLGLKFLSVVLKIQFIRNIVTAMTGNPAFPSPNPPLASLTTIANELEASYNTAEVIRQISQEKTTLLDNKENEADNLLTRLGLYVENESGGDAAKIQSAGMDTKAPATPLGPLTAPANFSVFTGDNPGELDCDWDSVRGAMSYKVEKNTTDPLDEAGWSEAATPTKSKVTLSGLPSGTREWLRVFAIGAAGKSGPSGIETKIVP